ncbi:MAG: ATP-binding protein [Deltaproteobacteria bacterium]|nr:ATP-binding protein [Deltaproteobacteria bacterium]
MENHTNTNQNEIEDITQTFLERFTDIADQARERGISEQVIEIAKDLHLQDLEEWLKEAQKDREELEKNQPKTPEAKWKAILLDLYNTLREQHSPDIWDYWGPRFEEYRGNRSRIAQAITDIYTALGLPDPDETPLKEKIAKIGERTGEEYEETLQTIHRVLAKHGIDPDQYQHQEYDSQEKALAPETILETILDRARHYLQNAPADLPDQPDQDTKKTIKTIQTATSPNILEELARYYDQRLYKLTEVAHRIPLWIASSFAPPILTRYGKTNSSINVLLIGETGTGKTTVKKLIQATAPKYITADVFTTPAFTGIAYKVGKTYEIQEGYIAQAHNGILAIPEIDKILKDPKLEGAIRESVEKMSLKVTKGGVEREFPAKYGLLLDSNFSGNDYFEDGTTIYQQMGTTRRLLSRIDDPIPFGYTKIKDIEGLIHFEKDLLLWDWDTNQKDQDEETRSVARVYQKIKNHLKEINCIGVHIPAQEGEKIKDKLHELIKTYNDIEVIRGRHFITALKYVYASTVLHAYNRQTKTIETPIGKGTVLIADPKDTDIALDALEAIIRNQSHILREARKTEIFQDYEDLILEIITRNGLKATRTQIVQELQHYKVTQRTAYRLVQKMIEQGKLIATKTAGNGKRGRDPTIIQPAADFLPKTTIGKN